MSAKAEVWDILPNGKSFAFWDDETQYGDIYHVAQSHPEASDANPGTEDRPFATIGKAAGILEPATKVVIHAGVY